MSARARLAEIGNTLQAIQSGWPYVLAEINSRIESLTVQLVSQESEQVRGRIKALGDLRDMPETLNQEREGISAALAEQAAAN
jgi:hypothetical protein